MPNLVGIGLSQVPTNSMLGGLAYQNPDRVKIKKLHFDEVSQINSEIADTANDVFVYDTSKDSDGGAWRHRTQHTSWYNETLNTTTRGSRREFPAVAVITVQNAATNTDPMITIYDGDDPDLPMWMVFRNNNQGGGNDQTTSTLYYAAGPYQTRKVAMLNGVMVDCQYRISGHIANIVKGVTRFNFIDDSSTMMTDEGDFKRNGNLGDERNTVKSYTKISTTTIVHTQCNDVAMTVLPNAPIDDATGLPIPTIAVATDGGVSIIKDDGNVSNITSTIYGSGYWDTPSVFDTKYIVTTASNDYTRVGIADIETATHKFWITSPNIPGQYKVNLGWAQLTSSLKEGFVLGGIYGANLYRDSGICIVNPNIDTPSSSMHCHINATYNSGYQVGDIKGAFLSDTDATNVTGSELITNGDFSSALGSEWQTYNTNGSVHTFSIVSGELEVVRGNAGVGNGEPYQAFSTVVGETYVITFTTTSGNQAYQCGTSVGGSQYFNQTSTVAGTTYAKTFTATSTTGYISIIPDGANTTARTDNVTVRIADPDRSVNENGLQVFGTITKSAVATGADLVAYSGFSGSNYLMQPYNSDLDVGTGDISVIGWFKSNSTGGYLFERMDPARTGNRLRGYVTSSQYQFLISAGTGLAIATSSSYLDGNWHFYSGVKRGSVMYLYADGVLLGSADVGTNSVTNTSAILSFGIRSDFQFEFQGGNMALWRVSASAPSAEQIKKMYEDEKVLFQENAACTLYGSSDAVTALAYDDKEDLLHVGTSSGRSDFRGLRRINNTTTAVTTAISAYDGLIAQQ